jgi:NADPH2:quinone reductase
MRALMLHQLGEPENLALEDVTAPEPAAGEVVVEMHAAAVNFPDLLAIQGKYQNRPELPFTPGREGAGVVAAVGSGVGGIAVGDRVMVQLEHGAFAEQVAVRADDCFAVPDGIGLTVAAAIGIAYQTAHFALVERAGVAKGETVLVTAATGSVGIATMQLARAFGCTVIAGLTTPAKADVARANGADHIIDLSRPEPRQSIRDQIHELTGGEGVDAIVELVGGGVFDGALRSLKWCGRLVVVGFTSGEIPEIKANYLLLKNIAVTGVNWSNYHDRQPEWVHRVQDEIFALYGENRIAMPIQASYPLAEFIRAFDVIRNREVRGKLILTMGAGGG